MNTRALFRTLVLLAAGVALPPASPLSAARAQSPASELLRTDSRTPYVHRLTLYDESGTAIDPNDEQPKPYSPRATCGKCHEYATIGHGWHFNAGATDVAAGRPGEPWVFVDRASGTAIPLSLRKWPGTHEPTAIGLSDWQFVLHFGRHMPGGGAGQPDSAASGEAKPGRRWAISGALEADCMACHAAGAYDLAEAARQVERQNFRWAPTAAVGLAVVRGETRKLADDWDPDAPPNPDKPGQQPPKVLYDATRFDADQRVFFDIVRKPRDERCYACHTNQWAGAADAALTPRWQHDGDVHTRAGLSCSDCHRHGIDHNIVRGYAGEPGVNPLAASLSCAGCHLGPDAVQHNEHASAPATPHAAAASQPSGRFGAPYPEHRGLPPIHLERLSCTSCHSGPLPQAETLRWQTSMAHELGIGSRNRTLQNPPAIVGPVFAWWGEPASSEDARITPYRQMWPAYWGARTENTITPLPIETVRKAARKALPPIPAKESEREDERPITDAQIGAMLDELARDKALGGTPVYVRYGFVYERNTAGVSRAEHPAAAPYRWAIAHDVRPARQALGAGGCGDCHSAQGPVDFGRIALTLADGIAPPTAQTMLALRGDSEALARSWIPALANRAVFKVAAFAVVGVVALVVWVHLAAGLRGLLRRIGS